MKHEFDFEPTLYIIIKRETPDMNPGKGMAQSAHAQAVFAEYQEQLSNCVHKEVYEHYTLFKLKPFKLNLELNGLKINFQ